MEHESRERRERRPDRSRQRPASGAAQRGKGGRNSLAAQEAQRRREAREAQAARDAERQRRERKKRESRAAQEAQRRREEKKERQRLNVVKEKQTKHAKQKTKWRISAEAWKRLLIMGGVIIAVLLSLVIFFRVQTIEVVQESQGGSYYSSAEIAAAAGISEGDNLLIVSRGEVAGNIMAKLPYIKSVRVTRKLPDTLVISVTEFEATYAVMDTVGDYYLLTANGKATERVTDREAKTHILIQDMTIEIPKLGEVVTVATKDGDAVTAQGQFQAMTALLQAIERAELGKEIVSISVPLSYDISLWYGDRFRVSLGASEELDYKLEFLKKVVAEQTAYASGTIDLSLSEGREARVMLDE